MGTLCKCAITMLIRMKDGIKIFDVKIIFMFNIIL